MSSSPHFGDRVRVVTIDGHPIVRDGIRDAIGSALEMSVVGEAGTVEQGFEAIRAREPDVAIVDVTLPDGHGFDLVRNLRAQRPGVQTLMFSICDEKIYAERALQAGASGYVMKASSSGTLLEAVREVAEGKVYLSEEMSRTVVNGLSGGRKGGARFPIDDLTERELQVFQMLGRGLAVDAIAERLNRARKTVEAHRRRAKEKLGCGSLMELIVFAVRWTDNHRKTPTAKAACVAPPGGPSLVPAGPRGTLFERLES